MRTSPAPARLAVVTAAAACVVASVAGCGAAVAAATGRRAAPAAATAASASATPAAPGVAARSPLWPGTYDFVAHGFPDGERAAVAVIVPHDTGYALASLAGPPGHLHSARFVGDSAFVDWQLAGGAGTMHVWMRVAGDSVTGTWSAGDLQGGLRGRRRPVGPSR